MKLLAGLLAVVLSTGAALGQTDGLVVHEWGTFTALQDESGRALGAINEDTEVLPIFVKGVIGTERSVLSKGVAISDTVTMRLETPVAYFHLPKDSAPIEVDFYASFHGGMLTQYYPDGKSNAASFDLKKLDVGTTGTLSWEKLTIGKPNPGPETDSPIWLAPRKVDAADITASNGEAERYLFYRGVGHLNAPVSITREDKFIHVNRMLGSSNSADNADIDTFWYLDIRQDGKLAYRTMKAGEWNAPGRLASTTARFDHTDYLDDSLKNLRAELLTALTNGGLFKDEAEAMLNTWESAYFKSPGSRVLFVVPKPWVEHYLPIKLSLPAKIERVMIGRIDLVTPEQKQIAKQYLEQSKTVPSLPVPPELGRFGGAILRDLKRNEN